MRDHIEVHSKSQSPAEWAAATGPGVESVFQYGTLLKNVYGQLVTRG